MTAVLGAYVAPATNSSRVCALVIPAMDRMNITEEATIIKNRILLLFTEVMITIGMNKRRTTIQATKD